MHLIITFSSYCIFLVILLFLFPKINAMSGSSRGWTTLEIGLLIALVAVIVGLAFVVILYTQVRSSYDTLLNQYNTLQSQYNSLQNQYTALKTNYTNLQNQYNSLQSQYNNLENQYATLQSQYTNLQNQYSSLSNQYSNVSNILNGTINGMGWSAQYTVDADEMQFQGLVYVPYDCTVTGTVTVSTSAPASVYVVDLTGLINFYTYNPTTGVGTPLSFSSQDIVYSWSSSYINQQISLTSNTPGGSYYALVIYNTNPYTISYTIVFTPSYLTCSSS